MEWTLEHSNFTGKRRKKRRGSFEPDSEYIEKATADYLAKGGKITTIKTPAGYDLHDYPGQVDDFLTSNYHIYFL